MNTKTLRSFRASWHSFAKRITTPSSQRAIGQALLVAILLAVGTLGAHAQTDNPRGVYKLTKIIDNTGTMLLAPFDQYKICTEEITLMVNIRNQMFKIGDNDHFVFNYTGEDPDPANPTASRIYDSDANHFTLKWWSTLPTLLFPKDDWCTEYYEANKFSDKGKMLFDAIMKPAEKVGKGRTLYGHWHTVGIYDEMVDVKKALEVMKKKGETPAYNGRDIVVVKPNHAVFTMGVIVDIASDGINYIELKPSGERLNVNWLDDNQFVVAVKRDHCIDYQLWQRITDDVPPVTRIIENQVKSRNPMNIGR